MVIRNYHWLKSASRVLLSTCSTPLGSVNNFHCLTLTYNPRLAKVKVDPHAKTKVKRFKQESAHRQTDTHTHGRYQTYYLHCYAVDKNFKF